MKNKLKVIKCEAYEPIDLMFTGDGTDYCDINEIYTYENCTYTYYEDDNSDHIISEFKGIVEVLNQGSGETYHMNYERTDYLTQEEYKLIK